MNDFSVTLFGIPSVRRSGEDVSRLPAKSLELLCFLLIHRDRAFNRELLSEFLWPDETVVSSRRYLRQALWKLNLALQPAEDAGGGGGEELIDTRTSGWLQLNARAVTWADVSEFDRAYTGLLTDDGERLSDAGGQALEQAVLLYRGELLAGWPQEWCLPERARFEQAYATMLEQLVAWCRVRKLYVKGVGYADQALRHDPARESVYRQLMRLHHEAGNRGEALRQYQLGADVLEREFAVRPSAQTRQLYQQLILDEVPAQLPVPAPAAVPPLPLARREAEPDPTLHARLAEIQASLQELMTLIRRDQRDVS